MLSSLKSIISLILRASLSIKCIYLLLPPIFQIKTLYHSCQWENWELNQVHQPRSLSPYPLSYLTPTPCL